MKIAFFVQHLIFGGVEKALLELTKKINCDKNDITIYVIRNRVDFLNKFPEKIKIKEIPMSLKIRKSIAVDGIKLSLKEAVSEKNFSRLFLLLYHYLINRTGFSELGVNFDCIPMLNEQYDIAVNFHLHSPFLVRYLSDKVIATRKYAWIHNDFKTTNYQIHKLKKYLLCIDRFFCVAENLKNEFLQIFPLIKEKVDVAYNILPVDEIKKLGNEYIDDSFFRYKGIKLLSVGRLEIQKGYDLTLNVCQQLKKDGFSFKWFIIGDGSLSRRLRNVAKKRHIDDVLIFLGICGNPYPYFKNCDIYVQTSRHEGYVTTVSEALIFQKPVICTDVSGAREQIEDGITGRITSFDVNDIYLTVKSLVENEEIRRKYSQEIKLSLNRRKNYDYIRYFL